MCRICYDLIDCTGHTPSYMLRFVSEGSSNEVWGKGEFQNVTGSIYDRVVAQLVISNDPVVDKMKILVFDFIGESPSMNLIRAAENKNMIIVSSSSLFADRDKSKLHSKGWRISGFFKERSFSGMYSFPETHREFKDFHVINLWDSEYSVNVFANTLAREIMDELGCVDYFVASIYDPSVLIGVAKGFKTECGKSVKVIGVEPYHISIVSNWYYSEKGGSYSSDPVLGIVYDIIPKVLVNNKEFIDGLIRVNIKEIVSSWKNLASSESLNVGYISGMNVAGATKLVRKGDIEKNSRVVTVLPDNLMQYMESIIYNRYQVPDLLRQELPIASLS